MLILPEYLLPRRPYPIEAYLFAIHEYCRDRGISQREAAKRTRARFGLTTFAHTTLGRALKRLCKVIDDIEKTRCCAGETGDAATAGGQDEIGLAELRQKAERFFEKWLPRNEVIIGGFDVACRALAGYIWKRYLKLLI
jgi:hypothetical protein